MLAQQFVFWCETATAAERCAAVAMLADAVVGRKFLPSDIRQAEAALMMGAEDPSPRVRKAIADGVSRATHVPPQLIRTLARDVDDVALPVIAHSPLLSENDLHDLVRTGRESVCAAVARRPDLTELVTSEIAATGGESARIELVRNRSVELKAATLRLLASAVDETPQLRHALLQREDLSADLRHRLLSDLGDALCASPFVSNVLGLSRAAVVRKELHERATASLIDVIQADEINAFVEHLRGASQLNAAILVRAVCMGRIDLFAASLSRLSGLAETRVRAIVAEAREPAFAALASAAGLPRSVVPLLLSAVRVWKDMAAEDRIDPADIASAVMDRVVVSFRQKGAGTDTEELSHLLHRLSCDVQRETARRRADRYLAA